MQKRMELKIGNSEVLETIDVDMAKVQALAKYINRVVNSRDDIENGDYTQLFSDDIIKNYSKIMIYNGIVLAIWNQ